MCIIFFIVTTSQVNTNYFVHSKYDQLPQMHNFKLKKDALDFAIEINKQANIDYIKSAGSIELTVNDSFGLMVDHYITNYETQL